MTENLNIKNRSGKRIAVTLYATAGAKGLAFVMHGLGGFKDQVHITAWATTLQEAGYTTVTFDARQTLGESEGSYEEATLHDYYEDLEDVISWAASQDWYQEPFLLFGHSLGAFCSLLFAEHYPEKVRGLAPIATPLSGKKSLEAKGEEEVRHWQESGWKEKISNSKPGTLMRLPWSFAEDFNRFDTIPKAAALTMPVLLMVGEEDTTTPPSQQEELLAALPGPKELHRLTNCSHSFREPEKTAESCAIIRAWLQQFDPIA